MLIIAEILGHGERSVAYPKAAARGFIHLAIHHDHVLQHTGLFHAAVELFALAAALADAAENTNPLLVPNHVVDHLSEQNRLADAGASEQTSLAAALQRYEDIDGFDTGFENLRFGSPFRKRRWRMMDRSPPYIGRFGLPVDSAAKCAKHAGNDLLADGRAQRT